MTMAHSHLSTSRVYDFITWNIVKNSSAACIIILTYLYFYYFRTAAAAGDVVAGERASRRQLRGRGHEEGAQRAAIGKVGAQARARRAHLPGPTTTWSRRFPALSRST